MRNVHGFRRITNGYVFWVFILLFAPLESHAQQARGLFFSVFGSDTSCDTYTTRHFHEKGYHSFQPDVCKLLQGNRITATIQESVFIHTPPPALPGTPRSFVAGRPMAFHDTVSEVPDQRITQYILGFWRRHHRNGPIGTSRIPTSGHVHSSPHNTSGPSFAM